MRSYDMHTCGGPRIVPFQSDMRRSSPLSRPYEHASIWLLVLMSCHDGSSCCHTSTETFLALLQLLEQTEVSRYFGTHGYDGGMERVGSVTRAKVGCMMPRLRVVLVHLCALRVYDWNRDRRGLIQSAEAGEAVRVQVQRQGYQRSVTAIATTGNGWSLPDRANDGA
jgi:hypothetical protein